MLHPHPRVTERIERCPVVRESAVTARRELSQGVLETEHQARGDEIARRQSAWHCAREIGHGQRRLIRTLDCPRDRRARARRQDQVETEPGDHGRCAARFLSQLREQPAELATIVEQIVRPLERNPLRAEAVKNPRNRHAIANPDWSPACSNTSIALAISCAKPPPSQPSASPERSRTSSKTREARAAAAAAVRDGAPPGSLCYTAILDPARHALVTANAPAGRLAAWAAAAGAVLRAAACPHEFSLAAVERDYGMHERAEVPARS